MVKCISIRIHGKMYYDSCMARCIRIHGKMYVLRVMVLICIKSHGIMYWKYGTMY